MPDVEHPFFNRFLSENEYNGLCNKEGRFYYMKENKSIGYAIVIGICVIASAVALGWGLAHFRSGVEHTIAATGSASKDFESDLIVWRGDFAAHADTSEDAYRMLQQDSNTVKKYLTDNGIGESDITFSSVYIYHVTRDIYDENGNYRGCEYDGYDLSQTVTVSSSNVDVVEKVSTDISSLLASGIQFTSGAPEYYYTKIDDLKLELIEQATENAKQRVDIMASKADAKVGKLTNSNLGVFQITAQNTGTSAFSYDGCLDTSSRMKTATITVKLTYDLR